MKTEKNGGFTLVELMVAILCGTIVTGLTVTVLILGLRLRSASAETALRQKKVRTLQAVVREVAEQDRAACLETDDGGWNLKDTEGQTILSGDSYAVSLRGSILLEDTLSWASLSDPGNVLTIKLETDGSEYEFSVYSEMPIEKREEN